MKKTLPTRLKIMRGTLKKSRVLEKEMEGTLLKKMPPAPETLTGKGKIFWEVTGNNLIQQGIMVKEDLPLFENYCNLLNYMQECSEAIKERGLTCTLKNKNGEQYYSKNKYFSIYLDCCRVLLAIGSEFGLSPASRTHIPAAEKKSDKQRDLEYEIFGN